MKDESIIASNIKRLREASGFTQEKVADYLGITRAAYANYESGIREIPLRVMERVSDLFGCELEDLYKPEIDVTNAALATAFRIDDVSMHDMEALSDFMRMVKNYIKMERMLR